jgi:hypothetical protein
MEREACGHGHHVQTHCIASQFWRSLKLSMLSMARQEFRSKIWRRLHDPGSHFRL